MLPHLFGFLHFFLTYLLPWLSFPLRIEPLRFQAGCRKRRLNLALVFVFIFGRRMYAFLALGLVFSIPSQERSACGNVYEMTYFVSSATWNHNSISIIHKDNGRRGHWSPFGPGSRKVRNKAIVNFTCWSAVYGLRYKYKHVHVPLICRRASAYLAKIHACKQKP